MNSTGDRRPPETDEGSGAEPDAAPGWRDRRRVMKVGKRLALREYLPFAGWTAAWLMIGVAIGHADAVRLLAANTFVAAVRALLTMEVVQVLARRIGAERAIYKASRRTALRIDLWALGACVLATAMLVGFLLLRGMEEAAAMTAIAALSLPARHPLALFVARRERDVFWRLGAAIVSVAGGAIVLGLGLHWLAAAVVLALRDWGGLVTTWLLAGKRPMPSTIVSEVLVFDEAATKTEASARRRLSYRMLKSLFGVLGPLGNLAVRTGRSAGGLDVKVANLIPRSRAGMILLTGITGLGAAGLLLASREPAALLVSAALLRIAGSSGAILLWWNYGKDQIEVDEEDE